jgi:uncharacterized protein YjbI with pentapeptide repeats
VRAQKSPVLLLIIFACLSAVGSSQSYGEGRIVQAERILGAIESGNPVEFDGYTITGAFDLDKLIGLPSANESQFYKEPHTNLSGNKKLIASSISITNCTINGWVNLNNTMFINAVDFRDTKFEGYAGFRGAVFKKGADLSGIQSFKYADFLGSEFRDHAYFNDSQFHDYADFEGAYFDYADFATANFTDIADFQYAHYKGDIDLSNAYFKDISSFEGADFNGYAFFMNSNFNSNAHFRGSNFNGTAYFWEAGFNGTADFGNADFNDEAYFEYVDFNGIADFVGASLNGTAVFKYAGFKGDAGFLYARFNQSADFRWAKFDKDAVFDWAYLKSADFNQTAISGDLSLKGSKIDSLNLTDAELSRQIILRSWKSIGHMEYDEVAYQQLLSSFRDRNLPDEVNECYYDYRDSRRATLPFLRRIADSSLMLFYGYGVKPERPVYSAFAFIALFGLLFWWRQGIMPVREGEPEEEANRFTLLEAMAFSCMTLLSGGKLVFDPPEYRIAPGKPWRDIQICKALYVWERLVGMMLLFMFAVAVTKTVILGS